MELGVRDAAEVRLEPPVELDRMDVRHVLAEVAREHAEARPDLEDDVVRLELGQAPDHTQDVRVDEEMLAEALPRNDAHSPNTRAALASICARELVRARAPQLGERVVRVTHERGLVSPASDRLRCEIRTVGLGEEQVGRDTASRVA